VMLGEVEAVVSRFELKWQVSMGLTREFIGLHINLILQCIWRASFIGVSSDPEW
jgi:hypothetical protein